MSTEQTAETNWSWAEFTSVTEARLECDKSKVSGLPDDCGHVSTVKRHFLSESLLKVQNKCIHWLAQLVIPDGTGRRRREIG